MGISDVSGIADVLSRISFTDAVNGVFLSENFKIGYDLTNSYSYNSTLNKYLKTAVSASNLAATKVALIAKYSTEAYTSVNAEVESSDFDDMTQVDLPYIDPENYFLKVNVDASDNIYFRGDSDTQNKAVSWTLTYCTGDPPSSSNAYSTILSGTCVGNVLTLAEFTDSNDENVYLEFPVSGYEYPASSGNYIRIATKVVSDSAYTLNLTPADFNKATAGIFNGAVLSVSGETHTGKLQIYNDSWTSLTFENCTFDGDGKQYCVYINNQSTDVADIKNITFNNCTFTNATAGSSTKKYSYGLLIDNKPGTITNRYPINTTHDVHDITVTNCIFKNLGRYNVKNGRGAYGVNIHEVRAGSSSSCNITINNNIFNNISVIDSSGTGVVAAVNGLYVGGTAIRLSKEYFSNTTSSTFFGVAATTPTSTVIQDLSGLEIKDNNISFIGMPRTKNSRKLALDLLNLKTTSTCDVSFNDNVRGDVLHSCLINGQSGATDLASKYITSSEVDWAGMSGLETSVKDLSAENFYVKDSTIYNTISAVASAVSETLESYVNKILYSKSVALNTTSSVSDIDSLGVSGLRTADINSAIQDISSGTTVSDLVTKLSLSGNSVDQEEDVRKARRKSLHVLLKKLSRERSDKIILDNESFKKFVHVPSKVRLDKQLQLYNAQQGVTTVITPSETTAPYVILPLNEEITLTLGSYSISITQTEDGSGNLYNGSYTISDTTTTFSDKRDENVLTLGNYRIVFGSLTVGDVPSSVAMGDPYITTIYGETYKMSDFTGNVRLMQGYYDNKLLTINAETKLLTKDEIRELLVWRQNVLGGRNFGSDMRFGKFPAYFSKLYISFGNDELIMDSNTLEILYTNYEPSFRYTNTESKGYVWSNSLKKSKTVEININDLVILMTSYADKDIRNGFRIHNPDLIVCREGLMENKIYTKDAKLRTLKSRVSLKQKTDRKSKRLSKEEIYEGNKHYKLSFEVY